MSLDNGMHERYFNLEYPTDDGKINELLRYIKCSDPLYQTEDFPHIVERVKYFKLQKEGVEIMCEIADRIRQERDLSVLSNWLKYAAASSSMIEFEDRMTKGAS